MTPEIEIITVAATVTATAAAAAVVAGVITMDIRLACLTLFRCILILYMFVEWMILFHDLYSFLARPICRFIFSTAQTVPCSAAARQGGDEIHAAMQPPCHVRNVVPGKKKSLGVDPKVVMERLGTFWDPDDDKRQVLGSEEMSSIFNEDEPSVEEVKEAFNVFDTNKDGYIDSKELQNVLSRMGYLQVSENDCVNMIAGYDIDKDGKINFREFLKLVEDSLH